MLENASQVSLLHSSFMLSRNSSDISTYSFRCILVTDFAGTGRSTSLSVNREESLLPMFFVGTGCVSLRTEFVGVTVLEELESPPEKVGNYIMPESSSLLSAAGSVEINNAS